MKHIKLYENFENSESILNDQYYSSIADDIQSVLVELRDNGLEISIMPANKYLYVSITDTNEDTFYINSDIYNRLLFLDEYLNGKYEILEIKINDDFTEPINFPFDIERFSDEIMNIEIQIYLKINK